MEKCPMYENYEAKNNVYNGNEVVFCSIYHKDCPYGNGIKLENQEGLVGTLCKTKGLVKEISITSPRFNIKLAPQFNGSRKINLPLELI